MSDDPDEEQPQQPKRKRKHAMGGELRGPDLKAVVGRNSHRIRHEMAVTQEVMARRIGVTASFLGGVERGRQNITLDSLSNLAAAYGVDAHTLVCGAEYGVAGEGLTLDVLARYVEVVNARVQELLLRHGPVAVDRAAVAAIIAALFEAATDPGDACPRNHGGSARRRRTSVVPE